MDGARLTKLGYTFKMNVKDWSGNKHRIGVYPMRSGGINYFESISDLEKWVKDVELVRAMQLEDGTEYERLRQAKIDLANVKAGLLF